MVNQVVPVATGMRTPVMRMLQGLPGSQEPIEIPAGRTLHNRWMHVYFIGCGRGIAPGLSYLISSLVRSAGSAPQFWRMINV